jgi:hypothetical protein
MKAEELRIGNWVAINDNIYQVDVIDYNQVIEIERGIVELKYVQPIPLTEEWLLRFGSVIDREDDSYVFKSGFYISVNDKSEAILFFGGNELCEFNYVHQLQNLYYALTGEELKLKS